MTVPQVKKGQRLKAALLNPIIDQANLVGKIRGGKGISVRSGPDGIQISLDKTGDLFEEPASIVGVRNIGPATIDAHQVISLIESIPKSAPSIYNTRSFTALRIEDTDSRILAIAAEKIVAGAMGRAYVAGVCACVLTDDSKTACETYGVDILWEEVDLIGNPITGEDRIAIVRFGGSGGGSFIAHRHLTEDMDSLGGGLAFSSFAPVTWAEYIAFGYQGIVPGLET